MSFHLSPSFAGVEVMTASSLDPPTIVISLDRDYVTSFAVLPDVPAVEPVEDRHSLAFDVSNQVGQTWREAVDAYRHIDPGRRQI